MPRVFLGSSFNKQDVVHVEGELWEPGWRLDVLHVPALCLTSALYLGSLRIGPPEEEEDEDD